METSPESAINNIYTGHNLVTTDLPTVESHICWVESLLSVEEEALWPGDSDNWMLLSVRRDLLKLPQDQSFC